MAETITMPKLGFDMAEGTLVKWVINEGQNVTKGAVLAEIETDKATVEVESAYDGIVLRHLVPEGEVVPVGTPIAIVGGPGETAGPSDVTVSGKISPKAQAEPAIHTGESVPKTGLAIASILEEGQLPGGVRASPVARRIAEANRIDIKTVPGSGPAGRITKKDIETYLQKSLTPTPVMSPVTPIVSAQPSLAQKATPIEKKAGLPLPVSPLGPPPGDEVIPLNRLRAAIGRRMTEAKQQVPHFYVTHEYDLAAVIELRKQINALLPEEEKISVNDFVVKAAALSLRQFPNLNASLEGNQVVRHGQINIGVAVAVEGGLLTVVSRDTDRKPLRQLAIEVRSMVSRARDGKVKPEDIEGSTFSVSNLGMFDVEDFIAIINPPEAAILAVGSAREVPVVKDGQIQAGIRMKATISVDHRVSDGVEAARFMQMLAQYLEEPLRLLV